MPSFGEAVALRICQKRVHIWFRTYARMNSTIEIDGSTMEGGGQILRMATVFSVLFQKPIRVYNIRGGRSNPGLRPQHLTGLKLIRDMCGGKLKGDQVGSTEITLIPCKPKGGEYFADTKTAGSVSLLIQVCLPCFLFADGPCKAVLKGGTNAEMAPQIDYCLLAFKPLAEKFGFDFECQVVRRGYYPKGGGEVHLATKPIKCIPSFQLMERGTLLETYGRSWVAGQIPMKCSHVMSNSAQRVLKEITSQIAIESVKEPESAAYGSGSGIVLMSKFDSGCIIASSALGKRGLSYRTVVVLIGKPSESVGTEAAEELVSVLKTDSCVDNHMQDQLIVFMALAEGSSSMKCSHLTMHTKTAIYIAELLSPARFSVEENANSAVITCVGSGHQNGAFS